MKNGFLEVVKVHFNLNSGIVNLSAEDALRLIYEEPDYHIKDLDEANEKGDYPIWTLYLQHGAKGITLKVSDGTFFDITKIRPNKDYPLQAVGKLTPNKNVSMLFSHV